MSFDTVIGYVPPDEGVILCPDCAEARGESLDEYGAIFPAEESDSPSHCDECGALIGETLTAEGERYVLDSLRDYIGAALFTAPDGSRRYGGSARVLDEWRGEWGDTLQGIGTMSEGEPDAEKVIAAYDRVREYEQAQLAVILLTIEGHARRYGEDAEGAHWTESEREDNDYDECAVCGAAVSAGWLCLDGGDIVCDSHVFTPTDARRVAAEWHGGQSSNLYALASSGAVLEGAAYDARIDARRLTIPRGHRGYVEGFGIDERRRAIRELRALAEWCEGIRSRLYPEVLLAIRAIAGESDMPSHARLARIQLRLDEAGLPTP